MGKAKYIGNCTHLPAAAVTEMVEMAKPITYERFIRAVGKEELARLFPDYVWTPAQSTGIRLRDDWHVQFCTSKYKGEPCVFVDHSSTEYVFLHRN